MKKRLTHTHKRMIAFLLVLSFVSPTVLLTSPQKTSAELADVIGGPSNVVDLAFDAISAGANTASAAAQSSLAFKEYVLDPLVVLLREIIIRNMTVSILNWINGGFKGKPAFIQDLGGFLLNVADEVAGTFIEGSELAFLCSPFQVDVRIALALDYYAQFRDRTACTLTGALQNIEDAFDYSSRKGWDAWFDISTNPNNTAVGAYTSAQIGLHAAIRNAQGRQLTVLDWGSGFQPFEQCTTYEDPDGSEYTECKAVTPGTVINEQLSDVLGSGFRQLELADEINEIIGALLAQLVRQTLGGSSGGLAGLSQSSYGSPSYVDRLSQENSDSSSIIAKTHEAINTHIQNEARYRSAKQTSLNAVKISHQEVEQLYGCYISKVAQNTTFFGEDENNETVSFTRDELTEKAANASTTISTLIALQGRLTKEIDSADALTSALIVIKTDIEKSKSIQEINAAVAEYTALQQTGKLKTIQDITYAELERDGYPGEVHGLDKGIIRDMRALNKETETDLKTCEGLKPR